MLALYSKILFNPQMTNSQFANIAFLIRFTKYFASPPVKINEIFTFWAEKWEI
jgi:hypothetical protein